MSHRQLIADGEHGYFTEHRFNESNCSNFLEPDWILPSGNSWEEEASERWYSIDAFLPGIHCCIFFFYSFL